MNAPIGAEEVKRGVKRPFPRVLAGEAAKHDVIPENPTTTKDGDVVMKESNADVVVKESNAVIRARRGAFREILTAS